MVVEILHRKVPSMKIVSWLMVIQLIGWCAPLRAGADQGSAMPLEVGAKASLGGAMFGGENSEVHSHKLGYALGGFARIGMSRWLSMQSELRYVSKGSQVNPPVA